MKRYLQILLPVIALAGAGFAIYYFYYNQRASVVTSAPDEHIGKSTESGDGEHDAIDTDPEIAIAPGQTGVRLEFHGTKMGATVGRTTISFSDNGREYEIKASARPAGVLRQLFSERFQLRTTGKLNGEKMIVGYFHNTTIKDDKKATKKEKIHSSEGGWKYTKYGKERKVDAKVFDGAIDPLALLFHIGRTIDRTGKCNMTQNVFMDETGFIVTVTDKGRASESGIKIAKKKIKEIRCDLVFKNRTGKVIKDYPFEHEFAKKSASRRANVISVYYSKLNGNNFVPVFISVRETPIGEVKIKLSKIS